MKQSQRTILTWRVGVAVASGLVAGLGLLLFSQHVARMDDSPNGRTPLSWTFKSNTANVSTYFEMESVMNTAGQAGTLPLPEIDRVIPQETDFALFALG